MFVAENFARTANFEVVHGKIKTAAEFLKVLNGLQATFRILGDGAFVGDEQIRIGLMVAASYSAPKLMQLRQAELIGTVHDDGIGNRNVNACFNDGCADKDIEFTPVELAHDAFKLSLAHLAVGNTDACFRYQLGEHLGAGLNGIHVVVKEIDLTAALELADDGLPNQSFGFAAHEGLDCQTFLRCCGDDGKVTYTLQTHCERSRNRCGGEREYVNFGAQTL